MPAGDGRLSGLLAHSGQPLTSFESSTPLRDFHLLAFSISFENDYLHVLKILHMAGIPLRAADRGKNDPLVVMGGAALFLNPEPLAPFDQDAFDLLDASRRHDDAAVVLPRDIGRL